MGTDNRVITMARLTKDPQGVLDEMQPAAPYVVTQHGRFLAAISLVPNEFAAGVVVGASALVATCSPSDAPMHASWDGFIKRPRAWINAARTLSDVMLFGFDDRADLVVLMPFAEGAEAKVLQVLFAAPGFDLCNDGPGPGIPVEQLMAEANEQ